MRMSRLFSQTLRDVPGEAELPSHQLLLKAGLVRPLSAGSYSYLPLARRALTKIEDVIREEMDAIGGQEITMPVVHPASLWQETGRWYQVGPEMARFKDRADRDMVLAMTHEEVIADLVRQEVRSYRQLPCLLYQIQTKYRDEPRARGGLIRVREFTMKDSYSLDADWEGLDAQYRAHYQAYFNIFQRCHLPVIAVRSDVGSHVPLGATPERVDVVLSVERLRRQLAYEPGDMTTTVQAGMPLQELQGVLGAQGQFVALDPPATAATTIGGVIATNASGPRRLLYGTARDVVLGISVVAADGTRTKAGGRVVKNVTGYDLTKLYIGSLGTLGVVLELTFKVHPLPPGEATIGIACADRADILPVLNAFLRLPLRLNSLELLNAAAMASLQASSGITMPTSPYLFLARLEGDAAVTDGQKERIAETLGGLSLSAPADINGWQPEEQPRLWSSLAAQAFLPDSVTAKVGLRITDVAAFCADIEALSDPPWLLHAHAGNGIVSVQIPAANGSEEALLAQIQALDACVARLNGHRVIQRAPVAMKRRCEVWGPVGDNFAVMQALKASYDPRRRLNPGRFIGGL